MGDQSLGFGLVQILTIIVPVFTAIAVVYFTYILRYKTPVIIIRQNISRVITPKMSPKPEIVFQSGKEKHPYKNLFIVDALFYNKSRKSFKTFDLTVTTRINADIIFADCNGQEISHKAVKKVDASFENPLKLVNLDLKPLNWNKPYILTLYITCSTDENQNLTGSDIDYSSTEDVRFVPEKIIPINLFNIKYHGKLRKQNKQ